jgi:hypothetical protein
MKDVCLDRVISAARKAGCYLEINAEPDRLDLNDLHAHAAKLAGVKSQSQPKRIPSCIPMHAVRDRSGAACLAHGQRRAEYKTACRAAQIVEAVNRGRWQAV